MRMLLVPFVALLAPALAAAAPPVVTVEAEALRVAADELSEARLEVLAPVDAEGRIADLEARLLVVKQAYAARGAEPERFEVRVAPGATLDLVRRVLHTLDVNGVARTEPLLDGGLLFPPVKAPRTCAARSTPCAEPRVVVGPDGLRAVLRYGTRDRRGACAERGRPGPETPPAWAGRVFPGDEGPALSAKALLGALAREERVRACPKATLRPLPGATAGDVRGAVEALRKAGYRDVVVEVVPPSA